MYNEEHSDSYMGPASNLAKLDKFEGDWRDMDISVKICESGAGCNWFRSRHMIGFYKNDAGNSGCYHSVCIIITRSVSCCLVLYLKLWHTAYLLINS
jgi:hypothetical protein